MKRIFLFVLILMAAALCMGEGPRFSHKDPITDREFENVYQDLRSLRSGALSSDGVILNQATLQSGATFYVSSGTISGPLNVTGQLVGGGTTTNDNACPTCIGFYTSSVTANPKNAPTTDTWGDLVSIDLTAGDWDVVGKAIWIQNGATIQSVQTGVHTTAGNSAPTDADRAWSLPPNATTTVLSVTPGLTRISLSGSATVYLKYLASYTVGTPRANGSLKVRRAR